MVGTRLEAGGGLLCVHQTVPVYLNTCSITPMVYRQEERTICQKQERHKKSEIKLSTMKEEILRKAELLINAGKSFVYNCGAKG